MFCQFFNMLYSMVDRILETVGIALASIGVCAPALTAVTAFAYMIGIGEASYMNISLGQKDHQRAKNILGNAFCSLWDMRAESACAPWALQIPVETGSTDHNHWLYVLFDYHYG